MRAVLLSTVVALGISVGSMSFAFAADAGTGADDAAQGSRSDVLVSGFYGGAWHSGYASYGAPYDVWPGPYASYGGPAFGYRHYYPVGHFYRQW